MPNIQYSPPVDRLFSYGDPLDNLKDWSSYLKLGISSQHIQELLCLLSDEKLYQADAEGVEWGVPVHAWRILGQLQAEAAITSLVGVLQRWGDDEEWWEWTNEELPIVFCQIGVTAIPALTDYLADIEQPVFPRGTAVRSIKKIAERYPEYRSQCVTVLTNQLKAFGENDPELNGYLVVALVDLNAVESAEAIEQAFEANRVDETFMGDWDEVQVELGLKSREQVKRKSLHNFSEFVNASLTDTSSFSSGSAKAKAKAKRKMQKQSRRQNRTKKK